MKGNIREILTKTSIEASAPCRIDMGGTLDLSTFYLPLRKFSPCTFNIALALKTRVRIEAHEKGVTEVVSRGFRKRRFSLAKAPFDHPLGLMVAVANYFEADGVKITIESSSPPRSALGGSSAAAVALVAAFSKAGQLAGAGPMSKKQMAMLAYTLEGSVAGVPCGLQDHLSAAFGKVHAWHWPNTFDAPPFRREAVLTPANFNRMKKHLLVAYCGIPHESRSLNSQWVKQFLAGRHRDKWIEICSLTQKFVEALKELNYRKAAEFMNREVDLRRAMTPWVLDDVGKKLCTAAKTVHCGARFTGAGGGGCIWALGQIEDVDRLRAMWENILKKSRGAVMLDTAIDRKGVTVHKPITDRIKGST